MLLLLICFLSRVLLSSGEQDSVNFAQNTDEVKIHNGFSEKSAPITQHNHSYIEKSENMLVIPVMNKFFDEQKSKKKTLKKSPKRTIQKIIKKNRVRLKRLYIVSSKPTPLPKLKYDNIYDQEKVQFKDIHQTTPSQKKKTKRWNSKVVRYPMPFQKMQTRREFGRRSKRSDDEEETLILKDLDRYDNVSKDIDVLNENEHVDIMYR